MKLEEFTTPISDSSKRPAIMDHTSPAAQWMVSLRVAQDLERKLAMCREALENCERSVSLAWIRGIAAETLQSTAP